jgi:SOS-response transcriptional repressor LexA
MPWLVPDATFETRETVQVDMALSEGSFAVTVEDAAMEPQFPRGAVLIVDAKRSAKDRSFVIASLGKSEKIVFRQLLTDGINHYLRSLSPDFSQFGMITMTDNDTILGVVLQARKDYLE